ncbi:LysM peptidoglycan-binding domain-containing protein [Cellulomonas soli]|uniref:Peptidoglycan-binding protein LysM n=1 Tax=Cellulomonas soli TaxID=931535 RepID=A0A512PIN5_9CELL|nr:LysM peptidoglycan-binding domain-containing protein [Cellulomonas soli]NYI57505.1 nucleoid-associated protein YgaU [Cellulomonas soli]GEP71069.1 peptidoglycan-binding protein LysM [Cellulomonas soli]
MDQERTRRLGGTVGLLCGTAAAAALTVLLADRTLAALPAGGATRVEDLVAVTVTGAGTAVAAWLTLSTGLALLCALVRLAGRTWRSGEAAVHRTAPVVVRRALTLAITTGVGLGLATGAQAATPPTVTPTTATATSNASAVTAAPDDLGWAPTSRSAGATETPETPAPPETPATVTRVSATTTPRADAAPPDTTWQPTDQVAPAPTVPSAPASTVASTASSLPALPPDPTTAVVPAEVVVAQGDSLWDIAAEHLPAGATDTEIAAAWPLWFEANRGVIGDDPDLLQPGQHLHAPTTLTSTDAPTEATR